MDNIVNHWIIPVPQEKTENSQNYEKNRCEQKPVKVRQNGTPIHHWACLMFQEWLNPRNFIAATLVSKNFLDLLYGGLSKEFAYSKQVERSYSMGNEVSIPCTKRWFTSSM